MSPTAKHGKGGKVLAQRVQASQGSGKDGGGKKVPDPCMHASCNTQSCKMRPPTASACD